MSVAHLQMTFGDDLAHEVIAGGQSRWRVLKKMEMIFANDFCRLADNRLQMFFALDFCPFADNICR